MLESAASGKNVCARLGGGTARPARQSLLRHASAFRRRPGALDTPSRSPIHHALCRRLLGRGSALALVLALASACGGAPAPVETAGEEEEEGPPPTYAVALRFEDAGADENETPHTAVALVRIDPGGERTVVELREEIGACYHIDAPDALLSARCWWAGQGGRYVVRREGDAVVALRADVQEETGEADLVEVGRLEVPVEAELQVLAPGRAAPVPE